MTAVLEISLALSVVASGIGRPLTRWISEHSLTRRQRDALDTLERLAINDPSTASLVAEVVRATHDASAPTKGRPPATPTSEAASPYPVAHRAAARRALSDPR